MKKILIICVSILLMAAAGAGVYFWLEQKKKAEEKAALETEWPIYTALKCEEKKCQISKTFRGKIHQSQYELLKGEALVENVGDTQTFKEVRFSGDFHVGFFKGLNSLGFTQSTLLKLENITASEISFRKDPTGTHFNSKNLKGTVEGKSHQLKTLSFVIGTDRITLNAETSEGIIFNATAFPGKRSSAYSTTYSEGQLSYDINEKNQFTTRWKGNEKLFSNAARFLNAEKLSWQGESFSTLADGAAIHHLKVTGNFVTSDGQTFTFGLLPESPAMIPQYQSGYASWGNTYRMDALLTAWMQKDKDAVLKIINLEKLPMASNPLTSFLNVDTTANSEVHLIELKNEKWTPLLQPASTISNETYPLKGFAAAIVATIPGTDKTFLAGYKKTGNSISVEKISSEELSRKIVLDPATKSLWCGQNFGRFGKDKKCSHEKPPEFLTFSEKGDFLEEMKVLFHNEGRLLFQADEKTKNSPWQDEGHYVRKYSPAISAMAIDTKRKRLLISSYKIWGNRERAGNPIFFYSTEKGSFSLENLPFKEEVSALAYHPAKDRYVFLSRVWVGTKRSFQLFTVIPETLAVEKMISASELSKMVTQEKDERIQLVTIGQDVYAVNTDDPSSLSGITSTPQFALKKAKIKGELFKKDDSDIRPMKSKKIKLSGLAPDVCYQKDDLGILMHDPKGSHILVIQPQSAKEVEVVLPSSPKEINLSLVHSSARKWIIKNPHKIKVKTLYTYGFNSRAEFTGDMELIGPVDRSAGNTAGVRSCLLGKQSADFAIMAFERNGGPILTVIGSETSSKIVIPSP